MAIVGGGVMVGTFSANGTSDSIHVTKRGVLSLDFGGGTVTLQRKNTSDVFVPTGDSYTADVVDEILIPGEYNLVCASYSSDIDYEIANIGGA